MSKKAPEPQKAEWKEMQTRDGNDVCWMCGRRATQIHHIERRSFATGKKPNGTPVYDDKNNFAWVCDSDCHDTLDAESHARQLARKLLYDPENFDRQGWHMLRHADDMDFTRVTMKEILIEYDELKQEQFF